MSNYSVASHLGTHYEGDNLELANLYIDSVIEVKSCFGYTTWPVYETKGSVRAQVCSEDIVKFINIIEEKWNEFK
jgi:hypothetical protein